MKIITEVFGLDLSKATLIDRINQIVFIPPESHVHKEAPQLPVIGSLYMFNDCLCFYSILDYKQQKSSSKLKQSICGGNSTSLVLPYSTISQMYITEENDFGDNIQLTIMRSGTHDTKFVRFYKNTSRGPHVKEQFYHLKHWLNQIIGSL